MFMRIFESLVYIDSLLWSYVGFTLVVSFGLYFTIKTKFYQFRVLANPASTLRALKESTGAAGVNPLKLYFASVGGMVGLGNIIAVMSALLVGGPGSLFWLWIASICGMLVKYSETYLGIKHRVSNQNGGYDGGPMYYLREALKDSRLAVIAFPILAATLLMIYGIEIYQFVVITDTLTKTFALDRSLVVLGLLGLVLYGGFGGDPAPCQDLFDLNAGVLAHLYRTLFMGDWKSCISNTPDACTRLQVCFCGACSLGWVCWQHIFDGKPTWDGKGRLFWRHRHRI